MARYQCPCGWTLDEGETKCLLCDKEREEGQLLEDDPMDAVLEFEQLFFELTGTKVKNAQKTWNGWLFLPPQTEFNIQDEKRERLRELANNNWKNHYVNGGCVGWWILPPSL